MKLWRKHNSLEDVRLNPKMKIKRKERRTHFIAEQKYPSALLCRLLGIDLDV